MRTVTVSGFTNYLCYTNTLQHVFVILIMQIVSNLTTAVYHHRIVHVVVAERWEVWFSDYSYLLSVRGITHR